MLWRETTPSLFVKYYSPLLPEPHTRCLSRNINRGEFEGAASVLSN